MTRFVMRVPDLGEGSVSAEVIAWKVAAGDTVREDAPLVELSTDKAVVEVPSPVSGVVVAVSGKPGDTLAVGSELAVFEVEGALEGQGVPSAAPSARPTPPALTAPPARSVPAAPPVAAASLAPATQDSLLPARVMASPATRRRAAETGLDLARVQGTGPGGRIVEVDLERAQHGTPGITEIPVLGTGKLDLRAVKQLALERAKV